MLAYIRHFIDIGLCRHILNDDIKWVESICYTGINRARLMAREGDILLKRFSEELALSLVKKKYLSIPFFTKLFLEKLIFFLI